MSKESYYLRSNRERVQWYEQRMDILNRLKSELSYAVGMKPEKAIMIYEYLSENIATTASVMAKEKEALEELEYQHAREKNTKFNKMLTVSSTILFLGTAAFYFINIWVK
jgi:hypothetical protein